MPPAPQARALRGDLQDYPTQTLRRLKFAQTGSRNAYLCLPNLDMCRISSDRTHPISFDGYHLISCVRDHPISSVGDHLRAFSELRAQPRCPPMPKYVRWLWFWEYPSTGVGGDRRSGALLCGRLFRRGRHGRAFRPLSPRRRDSAAVCSSLRGQPRRRRQHGVS